MTRFIVWSRLFGKKLWDKHSFGNFLLFGCFFFSQLSVLFTWVLLDCCVYVSAAECVVLSATAMFKGTEKQKYSFTAQLKGKSPAFRDACVRACVHPSVLHPEVKVVHFCCMSSVWSVNQVNRVIFRVIWCCLMRVKRYWQSENWNTRTSRSCANAFNFRFVYTFVLSVP